MPLIYIFLGEFFPSNNFLFLIVDSFFFHFFSLREDPLSCLLVSVKH